MLGSPKKMTKNEMVHVKQEEDGHYTVNTQEIPDTFTFTEEQLRADRRIKNGENLLLMGPGGTGKTFVVMQNDNGKTLYIAPTGMAALNLNPEKAMTIHSTLKCGEKSLNAWNWEKVKKFILKKKKAIKEFFDCYDRIVIDEGSMIISGLFNTLVFTIQSVYKDDSSVLFHNKQVIFLMDALQLPCVKNSESNYLDLNHQESRELDESDRIINNTYFKNLFNKERDNIINFKINNRCTDKKWCRVLECCRENFKNCSEQEKRSILKFINSKRISSSQCFEIEKDRDEHDNLFDAMDSFSGSSTSSPTQKSYAKMYKENTKTSLLKYKVHKINIDEINDLKKKGNYVEKIERQVMVSLDNFLNDKFIKGPKAEKVKLYYNAVNYMDDLGGYYSHKYYDEDNGHNIIETELELPIGARVMLRTNNVHPRLKNGSLGEVVSINHDHKGVVVSISVKFEKVDEVVDVPLATFKHPDLSMLTINAFPLIPAWAITIHKLQGQTIDAPLFIDYNNFRVENKYHLLYTAISRCKRHQDVYIISDRKITTDFFPVDPVMYDWYIENK